MSLKLQTSLSQKMILTPQLRQRIEMLQMTSLELTDLIQTELISNPILEEVESNTEEREISDNILDQNSDGAESNFDADNSFNHNDSDNSNSDFSDYENYSADAPSENGFKEESFTEAETFGEDFTPEKADPFEEIDYGREFQDYLDPGYKTQEFEFKEDAPSFEMFLSKAESLADHLEFQLSLQPISNELAEIADFIIGNVDGDGRLKISVDEIAEVMNCSPEKVEKARQLVLSFEPVGCGARNVQECLIAQLVAGGNGESLAVKMIANHFTDLQPHRLQHLSKDIGVSLEDLSSQLQLIRSLEPYPGRCYSTEDPIYVAPEIYIEKIDDDYVIYFADDGSPRLRISQTYQSMLKQVETNRETKDFIKDKVRSAVDLLRNIEHRRQTIYRVVECIIQKQSDFLEKGVQFIKPMMLKDVAEDIGMHLSTISRVVNRKYAHTPQGVIELRKFFSEGMLNEDGEEVSTRIIKLKIKKLIEEEDSRKPITDDDMAKLLSKEGIKLSRRTVAKYRDQMQIAGSRERKTVM
jgi:RNA polymerase sigma-54 factor